MKTSTYLRLSVILFAGAAATRAQAEMLFPELNFGISPLIQPANVTAMARALTRAKITDLPGWPTSFPASPIIPAAMKKAAAWTGVIKPDSKVDYKLRITKSNEQCDPLFISPRNKNETAESLLEH